MRVVPELPRSSDDLAWDTNQQETPGSPTHVYGLAGKTGNEILNDTLDNLFDTPAAHNPNMPGVSPAKVLNTTAVNESVLLAVLVGRAQYTAATTGRNRLWRTRAAHHNEHLHCVMFLVSAVLCQPVTGSGHTHPFAKGLDMTCHAGQRPEGHKLGAKVPLGLVQSLQVDDLFADPETGEVRGPALARQAICPWDASFDGEAGTAKFQQAVRQGGLSAAELLEQTRECGNIFGINAFDNCLPPKSTTEVCDIPCLQHGRKDFKFGVVVHNCNPAADPDNNCGCLNASAVLLPRADHNGQPLRLADGTAKTCILARDVEFPTAGVKQKRAVLSMPTNSRHGGAGWKQVGAIATAMGTDRQTVAHDLVRGKLFAGEAVQAVVDDGNVHVVYTHADSHVIPAFWDDARHGQAKHTDPQWSLASDEYAVDSEFGQVLLHSLIEQKIVAGSPIVSAISIHTDNEDLAAVLGEDGVVNDLVQDDDNKGAFYLKSGMVCELNPDPQGLFGVGQLAVFAGAYKAVLGWVGLFWGRSLVGGDIDASTGGRYDHSNRFAVGPGLFTLPLHESRRDGERGTRCGVAVLPVLAKISDQVPTSALFEQANATSCTLRSLMLHQRECFALCNLFGQGHTDQVWMCNAYQDWLWTLLSPIKRPGTLAGNIALRTSPSGRGPVEVAAGACQGLPRRASLTEVFQHVPDDLRVATLKMKNYKGTYFWASINYPALISTKTADQGRGYWRVSRLEHANMYGLCLAAPLTEATSQPRTKKPVYFLVHFLLKEIHLWLSRPPRWDTFGDLCACVVSYDKAKNIFVPESVKGQRTKHVYLQHYECSKTDPSTVTSLLKAPEGTVGTLKQFLAEFQAKIRTQVGRKVSGLAAKDAAAVMTTMFGQAGVECKFPTTAPPPNPNFSRGQLGKKGTSKHKVVGTSDCDESTSDSSEPKEATSRHAVATSQRATSRRPNVPTSQRRSRKRKGSNQQVELVASSSDSDSDATTKRRRPAGRKPAKIQVSSGRAKLSKTVDTQAAQLREQSNDNVALRKVIADLESRAALAEREVAALKNAQTATQHEGERARDPTCMVPWTKELFPTMLAAQIQQVVRTVPNQMVMTELVNQARQIQPFSYSAFYEAVSATSSELETMTSLGETIEQQLGKRAEYNTPEYNKTKKMPLIKWELVGAAIKDVTSDEQMIVYRKKPSG